MTELQNRLRALREKRGESLVEVAAKLGISHVQLSRLELQKRDLKVKQLPAMGKALGVPPEDILTSAADVAVLGTIGAGGQVFETRRGARRVAAIAGGVKGPRGADVSATAALRVEGRALEPMLPEGWVAFYEPRSKARAADLVGQLCFVRIDSGMWLKQIKRGPTAGRFNLVSPFAALVEDSAVTWCAPVLCFSSPDLLASAL